MATAGEGPRRAIQVEHYDLDGARDWMSTICGPHSLQACSTQQVAFEHSASVLAGLSTVLGRIQYGTDVLIGTSEEHHLTHYSISLPLQGRQRLQAGRSVLDSDATRGLIVSPFARQRLHIDGDCRKIQVAIPCNAMHQVLEELLRRREAEPLVFAARIDASHGIGAGWWRMVRYLLAEMEDEQPYVEQVAVARELERSLIKGLILSQPNNHSAALQRAASGYPLFLQKALHFIENHCAQDVRLSDIERAAEVATHRLHEGFKTHFGLSPVAYLKRHRLQGARRSLLEGRGTYNVAAIAEHWGLTHLGRFAADYQQLFGELPSETLRRARGHGVSGTS